MSIIDDTIKRLGEDHTPLAAAPTAQEPDADSMSELDFVVGPRKRRPPVLLMLFMIFAGAGVIVYVWLLNARSPSSPASVQTEPKLAAPAPEKVLTGTPVSAPVATMVLSKTPAVASQPSAPPAAETIATVSTPRSTSAVASQVEAAEVSPKQSVVAEVEPQGVMLPPSWYEEGWSAARLGKWSHAFSAWEDGVRGLPKNRMIIISNGFAELDAFSAALGQYVKTFPAIGLRQRHYNGQMIYRLVVFPYGGGTRQLLPKVQRVFAPAVLVNASYMQAHMVAANTAWPMIKDAATSMHKPAVAANQARPTDAEQAHPLTSIRMPADNMNSAAGGATKGAATEEANAWASQTGEVRELLEAQAFDQAARHAQALTRDFPDRWESWFWLGTAQLAEGRIEEADATLERAGTLDPTVAQVLVQRAVVAQERGDNTKAIRLLINARELSPKSPQIYLNMGYSNDALGLSAEAEKNYRYYLSLTEGDAAYSLQRSLVTQRLERKR